MAPAGGDRHSLWFRFRLDLPPGQTTGIRNEADLSSSPLILVVRTQGQLSKCIYTPPRGNCASPVTFSTESPSLPRREPNDHDWMHPGLPGTKVVVHDLSSLPNCTLFIDNYASPGATTDEQARSIDPV